MNEREKRAGDALAVACAEVENLSQPAYVKDSELRYLAVNEAYARLIGCDVSDLIASRDDFLPGGAEVDEKERRSLVFGKDQTALFTDPASSDRYRVRISRGQQGDGATFIVGRCEPFVGLKYRAAPVRSATPRSDAPRAAAPGDDLYKLALNDVDAGIVIYDANDILVFANLRMKEIFRGAMPDLVPGIRFHDVLAALYDNDTLGQRSGGPGAAVRREQWIADRIALHHKPRHESVEQLSDGRWIKAISRRIENGAMIGVRMDITEIKQQEIDLQQRIEEVQLYKAVLDELPNSTYVKDENFRLTFINRAYTTLTGWASEEVLGKTDIDLFGEEGRPFLTDDRRVLATGEISEQEEKLTRRTGEELTLVSRKTRVRTADGRAHMIGSSLDITSHKQHEIELFEARRQAELSRADLEHVIDGLDMGVVVIDAEDRIEVVNEAYFRIWKDRPLGDLVGRHVRCLMDVKRDRHIYDVADADWEEYVDARLAEIRAGSVAPREMVLADGRTLIYSVRALSMDKRMVCHFDISEQKAREKEVEAAQHALEQASGMMREATSAMAQGLCIYDDEIRLTNDAFHELTGLGPDEIGPGTPWETMIHQFAARGEYGDEERTRKTVAKILDDGRGRRPHRVERRGADGRWLRIDAKPGSDGSMVTTYTDISETKVREEELKHLLVQAELADRAKSEFLANMSHEIRTPMNGVLGMAELLARTSLDTRQKTFTDVIVKSGNALLTIINDILDFSKIDAGRLVLDSASFNIAESVEDVATLVSSQIAEKDIELIVRAAPDLPESVIGDAGRVRQIMTNLLGNAVKFTEVGHVLVDVSASDAGEDVAALTIRVQDTGIGIPADRVQSIFEKFSQVDGSSTRRHEGTGLGLAIAARLIEMMGGTIGVESVEGEGSTFTVTLQLPVDRAAPRAKPVPFDVGGARILVVDDNPVNRQIVMEQLNAWGFDGCAVASGREGIAVLHAACEMGVTVDALILDYHMPEMNGADVALEIRADAALSAQPIIMLTSIDIKSDESRFAAMKVQAHVMKPARSSLLLETIVNVLLETRHAIPEQPSAMPHARQPAENLAPAHAETAVRPVVPVRTEAGAAELDILVAEDNEVNQIVFTQILEDLDVSYRIVSNGQRAVAEWDKCRPRMILMDVSMPVMNGHEATREIRRREDATGGRVPIVGVTAHALKGDRERCMEAGMDDYLSKPISPEKLGEKVRQWLGPLQVSRTA